MLSFLSLFADLKKYLPWIVVAGLLVGIYAGSATLIKEWKTQIYNQGVQDERGRQQDLANQITASLTPKLQEIDDKAGKTLVEQHTKEVHYVDSINKEIANNPAYSTCSISDSVLDNRNKIRESLTSTLNPGAGSNTQPETAGTATNK